MNSINEIILSGRIRNIRDSHTYKGVKYSKADIIVPRGNGKDDTLELKFRTSSNKYLNNQQVELIGNIRSYSSKREDGSNNVEIYVFTYFDIPDTNSDEIISNQFVVSGTVCKTFAKRIDNRGKESIHFILANNIIPSSGNNKIDTYIPCACYDKMVQEALKLNVGDDIEIVGQLHSNMFKKKLPSGEMEFRTGHIAIVNSILKSNEN